MVGAGNSGAEIALDAARSHSVWLSGRDTGHIPFRIDSVIGRLLVPVVLRFLFHRVLTTSTPIGRKVRPKLISHGHALIRVKPDHLTSARVERVAPIVGVRDYRCWQMAGCSMQPTSSGAPDSIPISHGSIYPSSQRESPWPSVVSSPASRASTSSASSSSMRHHRR